MATIPMPAFLPGNMKPEAQTWQQAEKAPHLTLFHHLLPVNSGKHLVYQHSSVLLYIGYGPYTARPLVLTEASVHQPRVARLPSQDPPKGAQAQGPDRKRSPISSAGLLLI
jgi:hypothetical protein